LSGGTYSDSDGIAETPPINSMPGKYADINIRFEKQKKKQEIFRLKFHG
jgi:hypothetical protein